MMDQSFPAPATLPIIEGIEIIDLLGKGGMSLVYKAKQTTLERLVAVKVLAKISDDDRIKRFSQEAKLTSSLNHPNIVKTISFGISQDHQPYLVMEYLDGHSLADELKQNGRLRLDRFRDIFLPLLSALRQAHEAGLVHRDIKPGNIMICKGNSGDVPILVDFGIAKIYGSESETPSLTKSHAVIGSPSYMSPEQCAGQPLDGRSDLYSLACVMYESLSGELPFSGDSPLEIMQKHCSLAPPTVSEFSKKIDIRKELADVTLWGLNKDPAKRPQTAAEFASKLSNVLEKITLDKVPLLRSQTSRLLKPQRFFVACAATAAVVVVLAVYLKTLDHKSEFGALNRGRSSPFLASNPRELLAKLALEFDPHTGEFIGADPEGRLAQLKPYLTVAKSQLRGSSAYAISYFGYLIQKKLHSTPQAQIVTLKQCLKSSLDKSGKETKETAKVHFELSLLYEKLGESSKVFEELNRCLVILNNRDTASLSLPDSLNLLKNTISSANCLEALGIFFQFRNKDQEALSYFDQAIVRLDHPNWKFGPVTRKIALLCKQGRKKEAYKCFDEFVESTRPYVHAGAYPGGEINPSVKNAVSSFGRMGKSLQGDGFIEFARKAYSVEQDFARQIGWVELDKEASRALQDLQDKQHR